MPSTTLAATPTCPLPRETSTSTSVLWSAGSLFDLETGEALTLPAIKPVAVHIAEVVGDEVNVTLGGGASVEGAG